MNKKRVQSKSKNPANGVGAYIKAATPKARPMLRQLRRIVRTTAPTAVEGISYGIPYYNYYGRLVYFAAFAHHVSIFAWGKEVNKYPELKKYQTSVGTLQFPIGSKIPVSIITKAVKARMKENSTRQGKDLKRIKAT